MCLRNQNLHLRAAIIRSVRSFFVERGFLEVETPHRIPANAPEEHIEPFCSTDRYLHTSPEVCMKRLLSRGHGRIFQMCRCWRSSERGSRHLPEFTMLEWYRSNSDYRDLITDCEELLQWVAADCAKENNVVYQGQRLNLLQKAERITVREAFLRFGEKSMEAAVADGSFDEIMVSLIEPALPAHMPVILLDYPAEMAALARLKDDDRSVAERFELYLGGLELANAFSELNSSAEQRNRFEEANLKRVQSGAAPLPLPEPFLRELSTMPPSAGIAFGVDRLVMLFADTTEIDDVIAFTPEEL
jgi:elongation factor P--(R)-beta-lysine ligase